MENISVNESNSYVYKRNNLLKMAAVVLAVHECTNGWMDGWMSGWMSGWMDGRTDGWVDGWIDG